MKSKAIVAIVLTLFLMSILTSVLDVQPVVAEPGTIYIRVDGSIDPPTANITSTDNVTYTFTDNNYDEIVIERNNIVVDGAGYTLQGTGSGNGIDLSNRNNVTIKNTSIRGFYYCIKLNSASYNLISENNITDADIGGISLDAYSNYNNITENHLFYTPFGLKVAGSSNVVFLNTIEDHGDGIILSGHNNTISGNILRSNAAGVSLLSSNNNTIFANFVTQNIDKGIRLYSSNTNIISGNNITNNKNGIWLDGSSNNSIVGNSITTTYVNHGILLYYSSNNSIVGNNITNNKGSGIFIRDSCNNTVSENNVTNNQLNGIFVYEISDYNAISRNNVTNNEGGIILDSSSNNTLRNNHMSGNQYNFGIYGEYLPEFLHDIDSSNTVDGKPVYYWINRQNEIVPANPGYVALVNSTNITVQDLDLKNNTQGLLIAHTKNSLITSNNMTNNYIGIDVLNSSNNTIFGNNIANNDRGIWLYDSSNNTISENNVTNNEHGFTSGGSANTIYHNNFVDNAIQVECDYLGGNIWDDGYPSGGNYWSNYAGVDVKSGSNQDQLGSDGIGDTPYAINLYNQDDYPLRKPYPWHPYDLGITSIILSKTVVGQGYNVELNVTIFNYGNYTENFSVTAYANSTIIQNQTTILASRSSTTFAFTWNTTSVPCGNYTVTATVAVVPNETDTADNTLVGGWVFVTLVGDVDGDRDVDVGDQRKVQLAMFSSPGDLNWNPNMDIDCDLDVDVGDQRKQQLHMFESW